MRLREKSLSVFSTKGRRILKIYLINIGEND
jgi:hypothetical protein